MRVVVVGAGLGGLSAACHLAGRGHDVVVLERDERAGRSRRASSRIAGYRFDTGSIGAHDAGAPRRHVRRGRRVDGRPPHAGARGPDVPRLLRRRLRAARAARASTRWPTRSGRSAAPPRPTASSASADGSDELYRARAAALHRSQLRLAARSGPRTPAALDSSCASVRCAGSLRPSPRTSPTSGSQQIFSFQSMYAGLSPFEALAVYCVITYMDTRRGCLLPRRWDARDRARARGRGGEGRRNLLATAPRSSGSSARPDGSGSRASGSQPARRSRPTPSCATSISRRRTARCSGSPCPAWPPCAAVLAIVRRLAGRHAGAPAGGCRASQHPLRRRLARRRSTRCSATAPACPIRRSSSAAPRCRIRAWRREGGAMLYVLEPVPNLDGNIDWTVERPRVRDDLVERVACAGLPRRRRSSSSASSTRRLASAWGSSAARRSRSRTGSSRPARSAPSNVDPRVPGLVLVGMGTVPGVGIPMVLLSGRLAADAGRGARSRRDHARRVLRALPRAEQGVWHDLLRRRPSCSRASSATTSTRCTASADMPTTSSTTSDRCRSTHARAGAGSTSATASSPTSSAVTPTTPC